MVLSFLFVRFLHCFQSMDFLCCVDFFLTFFPSLPNSASPLLFAEIAMPEAKASFPIADVCAFPATDIFSPTLSLHSHCNLLAPLTHQDSAVMSTLREVMAANTLAGAVFSAFAQDATVHTAAAIGSLAADAAPTASSRARALSWSALAMAMTNAANTVQIGASDVAALVSAGGFGSCVFVIIAESSKDKKKITLTWLSFSLFSSLSFSLFLFPFPPLASHVPVRLRSDRGAGGRQLVHL